jgi:hypothetical protein
MGNKGFIWLILFVITIIFIIQNLNQVSLVFFGSKSIYLPLSIWVMLFIIAGIISSLIIQGLNNLSKSETPNISAPKKAAFYSSKNPYPKPSPSPQPIFTSDEKLSINNDNQEDFYEFTEPLIKDNINSNQPDLMKENEENIEEKSAPIININKEQDNYENNENNQNRQASLYSYKPKEKTEIRPKILPKNKVYDAPYRIITPPYQDNNSPKNNDDYEEEEWNF